MNKYYKLNVGFKPWWCETFQQVYPSKHIETILEEEYWEDYYEEDVLPFGYWWKEIKNVQLNDNTLYLECDNKNIPSYIKYKTEDKIFYFYLYSKTKITSVSKNNLSLYGCVYFLDKYMTIYFDKLQLLYEANPLVKFNHKYCVPWTKIDDDNYEFNFVKKKELSSYINDINYELIRNEIFSITEQELYEQLIVSAVPSELSWLKEPANTGRYRYIVLKSSALSKKVNDKIVPKYIKQTIIIVPIKDDEVLNKINNVNFESQDTNGKIIIGDNFIGTFECDLPFSYLYGLSLKHSEIQFLQDDNEVNYFEVPINFYTREILISYAKYNKGFYGKLKYLFENFNKIIPETEIALLAPQYYRETYNNGSGIVNNDFSKFIFKWNKQHPFDFGLYITIQFNNDLCLAYNYGENTNKQLASYDNTNVEVSNISIPIGLVGSAATQYYSNNINTALTSIQNRKLDQEQARRNKDFDCGKTWLSAGIETAKTWMNVGTGGHGIMGLLKAGKDTAAAIVATVGILTKASIDTAQQHYNFIDNQLRANRELNAQINNIYSAPNINLANPFIKGIIPNEKDKDNKYTLFKHYAYELHPYDKKLIFAKLLDEGYIYNAIDNLQNFMIRKYMNVLDINPYMHYTHLLAILKENDNTYFNTTKDFDDFFIWLAIPKKIYNTNKLINVLDWEEPNYIDNILIEQPVIPILPQKIDINNLEWIFPKWLPNLEYDYSLWKQHCLNEIIELNDEFDENLWNVIDITIEKNGNIIIEVINENLLFKGKTFFSCNFWVYKFTTDNDEIIYIDNKEYITNTHNYKKLEIINAWIVNSHVTYKNKEIWILEWPYSQGNVQHPYYLNEVKIWYLSKQIDIKNKIIEIFGIGDYRVLKFKEVNTNDYINYQTETTTNTNSVINYYHYVNNEIKQQAQHVDELYIWWND